MNFIEPNQTIKKDSPNLLKLNLHVWGLLHVTLMSSGNVDVRKGLRTAAPGCGPIKRQEPNSVFLKPNTVFTRFL